LPPAIPTASLHKKHEVVDEKEEERTTDEVSSMEGEVFEDALVEAPVVEEEGQIDVFTDPLLVGEEVDEVLLQLPIQNGQLDAQLEKQAPTGQADEERSGLAVEAGISPTINQIPKEETKMDKVGKLRLTRQVKEEHAASIQEISPTDNQTSEEDGELDQVETIQEISSADDQPSKDQTEKQSLTDRGDEELTASIHEISHNDSQPPEEDELDQLEKQQTEQADVNTPTTYDQSSREDGQVDQVEEQASKEPAVEELTASIQDISPTQGKPFKEDDELDQVEEQVPKEQSHEERKEESLPTSSTDESEVQPVKETKKLFVEKLNETKSFVEAQPRKRKLILLAILVTLVIIATVAGVVLGNSSGDESGSNSSIGSGEENLSPAGSPKQSPTAESPPIVFTPLGDTFPYTVPTNRFTPYHELDSTSKNVVQNQLGYTEVTWNNIGLNPIEWEKWNDLSSNERGGARQLGLSVDTWDCFVNHYSEYAWSELSENIQVHYQDLGWTQSHWEEIATTLPSTESKWWGQLTDNEKKAANGICYFKGNWDKVDMTPNSSYFPYPVPEFRYRPWDALDSVTSQVATTMLGYTDELWDDPGSHFVEKNTYLNLESEEQEGASYLGFYTHTWDCHVNHYLSYYWSSFHEDLKVAVETLGWDEDMWTGVSSATPKSEDKMWADLTPEEKAAATRLCYFREIWDGEPLSKWYDYALDKNTGVTVDGPLPNDINLGVFNLTGYVGRPPASVGR